MGLQPQLKDHQNPDQLAVVRSVTIAVQAQGLAQELRAKIATLSE